MTFAEFIAQCPAFFGLKLVSDYFGRFNGVFYYPTEGDYHARHTLPTGVDTYVHLLRDVLVCTRLEALEVQFEDVSSSAMRTFFENLGVFSRLRFLYFHSSQPIYDSDFGHLDITGLPLLERLEVRMEVRLAITEPLPHLRELILYRTKISPTRVLSQLNPKMLTALVLRGCARYTREKEEVAIEAIGKFKELRYLNLSDNKLRALRFSLTDLPALVHLDLSTNAFLPLTEDFMGLDNLQKLGIASTRIVKQTHLKTGGDFLQILENCRENGATPDQRRRLFCLLVDKKYKPQNLTEWLDLYRLVPKGALHQQLLSFLEDFVTGLPAEIYAQSSPMCVYLIGKMQGMNAPEIKALLKRTGITQAAKLSEKVHLACVGEHASVETVMQIIAQNVPFCTPSHLKQFLATLETPYLLEADENTHENLENLLRSSEMESRLVALQLMKAGGIPAHIFPYLCLELFYENGKARAEILALLRRYTTAEQFLFLQNAYKAQKYKITVPVITRLISGDFGAPSDFARAIIQYYKPAAEFAEGKMDAMHEFYTKFAVRLWRNATVAELFWEAHYRQDEQTLDLRWFRPSFNNLPKTFFRDTVRRVLTVTGYTLREVSYIKRWEKLEEFVVYCPMYREFMIVEMLERDLPAHIKVKIVRI